MIDYTVTAPQCISDPNFFKTDCGDPAWSYGLFISWNILSMYIFANMVFLLPYIFDVSYSLLCTKTFRMSTSEPANFVSSLETKREDSKRHGRYSTNTVVVTYEKTK